MAFFTCAYPTRLLAIESNGDRVSARRSNQFFRFPSRPDHALGPPRSGSPANPPRSQFTNFGALLVLANLVQRVRRKTATGKRQPVGASGAAHRTHRSFLLAGSRSKGDDALKALAWQTRINRPGQKSRGSLQAGCSTHTSRCRLLAPEEYSASSRVFLP